MQLGNLQFSGMIGWVTGESLEPRAPGVAGGAVLRSTDGGTSWHMVKRLLGTPASFLALSADSAIVSEDTCNAYGNAVCAAAVLGTADGGAHWSPIAVPAGIVVALLAWPGQILAMELVNLPANEQMYGGALGEAGLEVLRLPLASEAASTALPASVVDVGPIDVDEPLQPDASIQFASGAPGVAVATVVTPVMCGPHGGCGVVEARTSELLGTTDCGAKWTAVMLPVDVQGTMSFSGADGGAMFGANLCITSDAGLTWRVVS
jgi:hypothetical protein